MSNSIEISPIFFYKQLIVVRTTHRGKRQCAVNRSKDQPGPTCDRIGHDDPFGAHPFDGAVDDSPFGEEQYIPLDDDLFSADDDDPFGS